jgi:hypothetical protein
MSLESEEKEEEPFEKLDDIREYQEMLNIIQSTLSSPEVLATEHIARSPDGDQVMENGQLEEDDDYMGSARSPDGDQVMENGQLEEDDDYVGSGVDDEMDTVDEGSEAEVFEDILDYKAEMERSQPSHSSASEYV